MKVKKTIRSYKKVWEILKEMGLQSLFEGNADGKVSLPITQILDSLLEGEKAKEFMVAITGEGQYFEEDRSWDKQDWEDVDLEIITGLVKDFFSAIPGTPGQQGMPGEKADKPEAEA